MTRFQEWGATVIDFLDRQVGLGIHPLFVGLVIVAVVIFWLFWKIFRPRIIERGYDLLIFLYNTLLAIGLLFFLIRYKLEPTQYFSDINDYFDGRTLVAFISAKWGVMVLGAVCLFLYAAVTFGTRVTREFVPKLFSSTKKPQAWSRLHNRSFVPIHISLLIIALLALAWFTDNVSAFSLVLAMFYLNALLFMGIVTRPNAKFFLSNSSFAPETDGHRDFILARRECVNRYLFERRHMLREGLMSVSCLVAFVVSINPAGSLDYKIIPYVVVSLAVICNEIVVWRWRGVLYRCIREVDGKQDEYDLGKQLGPSTRNRSVATT